MIAACFGCGVGRTRINWCFFRKEFSMFGRTINFIRRNMVKKFILQNFHAMTLGLHAEDSMFQ